MELEIGMYARTIKGKIWIINSQQAISGHKRDIINTSYNLLDLIEPLDLLYVDFEGIKVYRIPETLNEVRNCRKRIESGDWKLLGITTKENIHDTMYMTKWKDE